MVQSSPCGRSSNSWIFLLQHIYPSKLIFVCNTDETGVVSCDGTSKALGDAENKKHQKSAINRKDASTIVRVTSPLVKGGEYGCSSTQDLEKLGASECSNIPSWCPISSWLWGISKDVRYAFKGVREMDGSSCLPCMLFLHLLYLDNFLFIIILVIW